MDDARPLADPSQVDAALRLFPYRESSAEQYAARHAHTIGCSSFDQFRYPDPALEAWIDELHRLLTSSADLERCRRAHLSPTEYEATQADINESAEQGCSTSPNNRLASNDRHNRYDPRPLSPPRRNRLSFPSSPTLCAR